MSLMHSSFSFYHPRRVSLLLLVATALISSCCLAFSAALPPTSASPSVGVSSARVSSHGTKAAHRPFHTRHIGDRQKSARMLSRLLATTGGVVSSKVTEVRNMSETEDQLEAAGDKLVILDFTAVWCGPCKMIAPVFDALSNEYEGKAIFLKVDVDTNEETAAKFEVAQMPTFVFVKQGEVVGRVLGGNPDKLKEAILKFL